MLNKIDENPLQRRTTRLKSLDELRLRAGRSQTHVAHMELTNGRKACDSLKQLDSVVMPLDDGGGQLFNARQKRLRSYGKFFSRSEAGGIDGVVIKRIPSFCPQGSLMGI